MDPLLTPGQLEALRNLDTCAVSNAIETFNVRLRNEGFATSAIHCMFPEMPPMLGYAVPGRIRSGVPPLTASLPAVRGMTFSDRTDWWNYILSIPEPRVVVMQDVDRSPGLGAFMGEVHSAICKALGCVGFVTNGGVRDVPAVQAMDFHVFAGAVTVSHAYGHMVEFGEPVEIGGLKIRPGDLVHGDRHGIQTIPRSIAAQVPAVAARQHEKERQVLDLCNSPHFSVEKLRELVRQIG